MHDFGVPLANPSYAPRRETHTHVHGPWGCIFCLAFFEMLKSSDEVNENDECLVIRKIKTDFMSRLNVLQKNTLTDFHISPNFIGLCKTSTYQVILKNLNKVYFCSLCAISYFICYVRVLIV